MTVQIRLKSVRIYMCIMFMNYGKLSAKLATTILIGMPLEYWRKQEHLKDTTTSTIKQTNCEVMGAGDYQSRPMHFKQKHQYEAMQYPICGFSRYLGDDSDVWYVLRLYFAVLYCTTTHYKHLLLFLYVYLPIEEHINI